MSRNMLAAMEAMPAEGWRVAEVVGRRFVRSDLAALKGLGVGDPCFAWEREVQSEEYYEQLLEFRIAHYGYVATIVRLAFERYANGGCTLETLLMEIHGLGLRSRRGGALSLNGLSTILRNPFYVGVIRIRKTNETFQGVHEPLVSTALFENVQARLDGKVSSRGWRHAYLFRRLLTCKHCGYALIGEKQKGKIYYRCHTRGCLTKSVREEVVDRAIRTAFEPVSLSEAEQDNLVKRLEKRRLNWAKSSSELRRLLSLQSDNVAARLDQLTDAYLDGTIDREAFTRRKERLLLQARDIAEHGNAIGPDDRSAIDRVKRFLELVACPDLLYESTIESEKRPLVEIATSNRVIDARNVGITLSPPFSLIAEREKTARGGPTGN